MAVLGRDDLFNKLQDVLGKDNSEGAISLIEDVTDTYNAMAEDANNSTDWKAKYDELDAQWREKYKRRFFNGPPGQRTVIDRGPSEEDFEQHSHAESVSISDLFTEVKSV